MKFAVLRFVRGSPRPSRYEVHLMGTEGREAGTQNPR